MSMSTSTLSLVLQFDQIETAEKVKAVIRGSLVSLQVFMGICQRLEPKNVDLIRKQKHRQLQEEGG